MIKTFDKKLNTNFNKFLAAHPMNYRNVGGWGKFYDELNNMNGRTLAFPVRKGEMINTGDTVMIDKQCEAYPISRYGELANDEKFLSEIVGTAWFSAKVEGQDRTIVFVREVSVLKMKNSSDPEYKIVDEDACSPCYVEDSNTVTKSFEGAFAGQIMGVENDEVFIHVRLSWEGLTDVN